MLKQGKSLSFIQVGANDVKSCGDPLRKHILKYRWTGVLIEPQPEIFEILKSNYAGLEDILFFENVAITNTSRMIPLYRAKNQNKDISSINIANSAVTSTNKKITALQLGCTTAKLEEILVQTTRLDDIVEKYKLTNIDILQIDTEGHEKHVLLTLDLTKTTPLLIQFEHGH